MKITCSGKPFICHICGKNHCANRCPHREESTPEKESDKVKDTPKMESAPTKVSVNVTIGEDWGDDTDYGGLMFCQVTAETATKNNPKMEYKNVSSQLGGHIIPI